MRVLIFECDVGGHRLQYVRSILNALAPLPVSTTIVAGRGVQQSEQYSTHLGPIASTFQLDDTAAVAEGGKPYRVGFIRLYELQKAIIRHRPDHVYVPYGDGLMQLSGIARICGVSLAPKGTELEVLLMRGRFAYGPSRLSWADRANLAALELAPFDIVHHLDPIVFAFLRKHGGALSRRIRLMPEAVEPMEVVERSVARARMNLDIGGRYVGCFGSLDSRKGMDLLIKAFAQAPLGPDARLLLGGHASPEIRNLLHGQFAGLLESGRIVFLDRYLSQEEFHLGLHALDLVCTPYPRHIGSSGIVVRAAAAGKPILGASFGWVGKVIRDFNLGKICDVENIPTFSGEIGSALDWADSYHRGPDAQHFVAYHTANNFASHWTRRLRERLKLDTVQEFVPWEIGGEWNLAKT